MQIDYFGETLNFDEENDVEKRKNFSVVRLVVHGICVVFRRSLMLRRPTKRAVLKFPLCYP